MQCWKCHHAMEKPVGRLPLRAACPACGAALHSCFGCLYYQKGLRNDCRVPGTDPIADKSSANWCEEFSPHPAPPPRITETASREEIERRLFGEDT